jgi:hypothetical protein
MTWEKIETRHVGNPALGVGFVQRVSICTFATVDGNAASSRMSAVAMQWQCYALLPGICLERFAAAQHAGAGCCSY